MRWFCMKGKHFFGLILSQHLEACLILHTWLWLWFLEALMICFSLIKLWRLFTRDRINKCSFKNSINLIVLILARTSVWDKRLLRKMDWMVRYSMIKTARSFTIKNPFWNKKRIWLLFFGLFFWQKRSSFRYWKIRYR